MIELETDMMIRKLSHEDLSICIEIAEIAYMKEAKQMEALQVLTINNELRENLTPFFIEERGYILEQDGIILGYMVEGYVWLDGDVKHIHIPVFGCGIAEGIDRQTILQKLFQRHADMAKDGLKLSYEIKLYECDKELITALVYEQFGFISLEGLKKVNKKDFEPTEGEYYVKFSKEEILKEKDTILSIYHSLVKHLTESPVFYPGYEFTDNVYMEYILQEGTNLYVVMKADRIIGMIDASKNENSFVFAHLGVYDVGDLYIVPEYRGLGIASRLLQFAENDLAQRGIEKLHVEHGTANINARLFWDKHFKTMIYSLIREINPIT